MRKIIVMMVLTSMGMFARPAATNAQATELAQLALNIEKLNQFRQILKKMYDAYEIISEGYGKVKDLASGNYKLHQVFLDGLFQVSPTIRKYERVADIVNYQASIVKEYKTAFQDFKESKAFSDGQLTYFDNVYQRLFDDSLKDLEELIMVITSGQLRMSDDERLTSIDRIYEAVKKKYVFLREFNDENSLIAIQKMREKSEEQTIRGLYDLK